MKAIHLIAKKLWGKLSVQMPNSQQAQQMCSTLHKGENYKLLLTPKPVTLGKSSFEIETRIEGNRLKEATIIHALHEHTSSGTVTYCSPSPAQIEGKWYEAYYRIKQHFEPLRE
jgi:hypothetical protein